MSDEEFFRDTRAEEAERALWVEYEARCTISRFEFGFKIACCALLAVVMGFDLWLVWLIWF